MTSTAVDTRPGPLPLALPRLLGAALWLTVVATAWANASVSADDEHWEVPYIAFAVSVVAAATTTLWVAVRATAAAGTEPRWRPARIAAAAIAALGLAVAVVLPWAYAAWAVIQGVGHLALAATGRAGSRWVALLAVVLLAGVAAAVVGIELEVGDPGSGSDHHQVQDWALAASAAALATVLAWRGARPEPTEADRSR